MAPTPDFRPLGRKYALTVSFLPHMRTFAAVGMRGARLAMAGGLAVAGAGGLLGALALTGPSGVPPTRSVHAAVADATLSTAPAVAVAPAVPAAPAASVPAAGAPTSQPQPQSQSQSQSQSQPQPDRPQPQPAIGAPAGSRCGGVCGASPPTTAQS